MSTQAPAPAACWPTALAQVASRHPGVRIELGRPVPGARLSGLSLIQTTGTRGAGLADAALADLCATADLCEVTLTLTPQPMGKGVSQPRLTRWYRQHGFVRRGPGDCEISDTMIRRPM